MTITTGGRHSLSPSGAVDSNRFEAGVFAPMRRMRTTAKFHGGKRGKRSFAPARASKSLPRASWTHELCRLSGDSEGKALRKKGLSRTNSSHQAGMIALGKLNLTAWKNLRSTFGVAEKVCPGQTRPLRGEQRKFCLGQTAQESCRALGTS